MKKSTKFLAAALASAAILFGTNVKAQTTPANALRLGIGIEGGIPTGSEHLYSNVELGATARLQYGLSSNVALTFTSGYYDFLGKTDDNGVKWDHAGVVPLKAGIKAFFSQNVYFGAEAGAGFVTNPGSNTKLILSPALGWANKSWDVGVRYENFSGQGNSFGTVALRLAYGFGL